MVNPSRARSGLGPAPGPRPGPRGVACPVCGAGIGRGCLSSRSVAGFVVGAQPRQRLHPARVAAYHAGQGVDHDGTRSDTSSTN